MIIGIHATAFRRYTIQKIAWTCLKRIQEQFAAHGVETFVIVGVSEKKSESIVKSFGFTPFMIENNPLGRKFDLTMKEVLKRDCDYVMEFCSDNVLDEGYVEHVLNLLNNGITHFAMRGFYLMNWRTKEVRIFENSGFSNVGRITKRNLLERMRKRKGMFFDHRKGRQLDKNFNDMMWEANKVMPAFSKLKTPFILDLKDGGSLHDYAGFAKNPERFPVVSLEGNFPEIQLTEKE